MIGLSLGLVSSAKEFPKAEATAKEHGKTDFKNSTESINQEDLKSFLERLASTEYEGRGTGDKGERMATEYLATFFQELGLEPAGDNGTYFQEFSFNTGKKMNNDNSLTIVIDEPIGVVRKLKPGQHYLPVNFSPTTNTGETQTVFAGFGINTDNYNSFEGLNVKDKWVIVFRGSPKDKKELQRFGPLVNKAQQAKKLGAKGIIYIKGPNPGVGMMLVPPTQNVGSNSDILPAITISDELAGAILGGNDNGKFKELFNHYYNSEKVTGFPLPYSIMAQIGLDKKEDQGRNVIARLKAKEDFSTESVMVGGHIDHLGFGNRGGTRAKGEQASKMHLGADDNASGIAAIMELAQFYVNQKKIGELNLKGILFLEPGQEKKWGFLDQNILLKNKRKKKRMRFIPRSQLTSISTWLVDWKVNHLPFTGQVQAWL